MPQGVIANDIMLQLGAMRGQVPIATAFEDLGQPPLTTQSAATDTPLQDAMQSAAAGAMQSAPGALQSSAADPVPQETDMPEDIIGDAFGKRVLNNALPVIDLRKHNEFEPGEMMTMGSAYPGGDVMNQTMWSKWRDANSICHPWSTDCTNIPPEEDWYAGARLGEYARPLIMGENKVGYLNQAPVPMSQSEDLFTLVSESGVGSRRARHAALYAKQSAGQAEEFFRLAQRRLRQVLRDPPLTVRPGADVYPLYSAAAPALLSLVTPPYDAEHYRARVSPAQQLRKPHLLRRTKRQRPDDFF